MLPLLGGKDNEGNNINANCFHRIDVLLTLEILFFSPQSATPSHKAKSNFHAIGGKLMK
jgi:hypothetical protein